MNVVMVKVKCSMGGDLVVEGGMMMVEDGFVVFDIEFLLYLGYERVFG